MARYVRILGSATVVLARRGHRGVGRAEGGHGATVGETGSGQPGCNTVPRVRDLDLDPIRELPCRPAVQWPRKRPDRWQHPTTRYGDPEVFPCPEGGVHRCCMDT